MKGFTPVVFILVLMGLAGCSQTARIEKNERNLVEFSLASISVKDLDLATNWYVENLGFSVDTIMNFPDDGLNISMLQMGKFRLELIDFDDAIEVDRGLLPDEYSNVQGFIKIGFITDSLEKIVDQMNLSGAKIIAGPADLPPLKSGDHWPELFYLVKDPNGIYVQFFEASRPILDNYNLNGEFSLAPFLAMISVKDFEGTKNWYENIGFKFLEEMGSSPNQRGILSMGSFILEIGSFENDVNLQQLNIPIEGRDKVIRLNKLGLSSTDTDSLYVKAKAEKHQFYYDNMMGERPSFILSDIEQNYVQFFRWDGSNQLFFLKNRAGS